MSNSIALWKESSSRAVTSRMSSISVALLPLFERYAIVNRGDIAEAMQKLESNRRELEGHVIGHGDVSASNRSTSTAVN